MTGVADIQDFSILQDSNSPIANSSSPDLIYVKNKKLFQKDYSVSPDKLGFIASNPNTAITFSHIQKLQEALLQMRERIKIKEK